MKSFLLKSSVKRKVIFVAFLSLIICTKVFSQPGNDNICGAIALTSSTTCNSVTGTFRLATKSPGAPNSASITRTSNGSWAWNGYYATSVFVESYGGGGAGGGATGNNFKGGGGGGGGYSSGNIVVSPGASNTIVVGTGGVGGTGVGGNGSVTNFNASFFVANGGNGGGVGTNGAFGNGGSATSGTTNNSGGNGANGGTFGNGGNGGTSGGGAAGGAGGVTASGAIGNAGSNYGGGGGGAKRAGTATWNGGKGGDGLLRITYPISGDFNSTDVWYKFVPTTANPNIVLSNIGTDLALLKTSIQLYSSSDNTCTGSLTSIGTSTVSPYPNPNTLSTSGLVLTNTYFIRVTTNSSSLPPNSGNYDFDICILDPLPLASNPLIDYSKSFVDITKGTVGGTINQGDILEIRATLVIKKGASSIANVSFNDTLKANGGLKFIDSLCIRTNEGKAYQTFTTAVDADAGSLASLGAGFDTTILINMGPNVGGGGTLTNNSIPNLFGGTACIIVATYRVRVDTGIFGYGRKVNYGGGAIRYMIGGTNYTIDFPKDSLIISEFVGACPDGISPSNLIGTAVNGTFGTAISSVSKQNAGARADINTTYNYQNFSYGPNDYYYGIANNTSATNDINQFAPKGDPSRVFSVWDITGDHTGAVDLGNISKGNKPCDQALPISASNPCGYMLAINASYRSDIVFEYQAAGVCTDTYYEVSAWFKNLCYKCGCDVNGVAQGNPGYIPTDVGDSSGVRPNINMNIDGVDYYTTGEIKYQGLGGTQSQSDDLNNWVRKSFVFKTGPSQNNFKITFRNNAPGGGGNDWAIDDIGLRTTYPNMNYGPSSNPKIFIGNTITLSDTVTSCYKSYVYYKWQTKPAASGTWVDIPGYSGVANPVFSGGTYQYISTYTVTSSLTQAANNGDLYRMVVATSAPNLASVGCNYTPALQLTLNTVFSNPCNVADTNFAVTPETAKIDWNNLQWSLKHPPTCCESAFITYAGSVATPNDSVVVNITNDICIRNLILFNRATATTTKKFKTVLAPTYKMLMNGNVTMSALANLAQDSCIFTATGNNNIVITGNTTVGLVGDNAFSIIGAAPLPLGSINYFLKGDSLTFNGRGLTSDRLITVNMVPTNDTAYLTNNTFTSPYPNAVTFESFKIGDGVKPTTVIAGGGAGGQQISFMNDKGGALEVTTNGVLVLPSNFTINAKGLFTSSVILRPNSKLRVGGYANGSTGSNFPANFITNTAASSSTVEYYGDYTGTQTVFGGINYGNLELRNASNANGGGRAPKIAVAAITAVTSININQKTDFTLGGLGSSAVTVNSSGPIIMVGNTTTVLAAGFYTNANVVSGTGSLAMGNYSTLGIGHPQGIVTTGSFGNIQLSGTRAYNTPLGNYVYNGTVNQITGAGLPAVVNEFTVDNINRVVTNSQDVQVNDLALMKQGTFDILTTKFTSNGINGSLNSSGGIMNTTGGRMKADQGFVDMKGTSGTAQTLSGNWFVNKTISTLINSNTKGITIAAPAADTILISTALLYGTGTTASQIATNNNLTLLSRSTKTARFGEIVSGSLNTITGTVNVERFIPATRKWRLLGWPTTSSQTAQQSWMEGSLAANDNLKPGYGTIITDEKPSWASGNFDSKSISGPSVKYYDVTNDKYIGILNTRSYTMNSNSAYYAYIRGDRTALPSPYTNSTTVLRSTGTLKTGTQMFPVTNTKFAAIGNPYASPIDLKKLVGTNIANDFYIWDPKITGMYGLGAYQMLFKTGSGFTIMPGGGSYPPAMSIIDTLESGMGLFVRSNGMGLGNVTFNEDAKTISARSWSRGAGGNQAEICYALLSIVDPTENTLVDGAMVAFDSTYSSGIDYDDAPKFTNTSENVSFKRGNTLFAIERRGNVVADDTLHLNATGFRIKNYQWAVNVNNMTNPGRTAFFIDKFLNTSTALDLEGATKINFDVTSQAATYAADRFMIVFKQIPSATSMYATISALRNADKTVKVIWGVANESFTNNYDIQQSSDGINFASIGTQLALLNNNSNTAYSYNDNAALLSNNWYRIKLNAVNGSTSYSSIVMVGPIATADVVSIAKPKMYIYPNPLLNGLINLTLENQPRGMYAITITNPAGQRIHTQNEQIENSSTHVTIKLGGIASGKYQATIIDKAGNKTTIPFIVK